MKSKNCFPLPVKFAALLLTAIANPAAQENNVVTVGEIAPVHLKRGQNIEQKLTLELRSGFHVNSNKPNDEFLIPLKLTWTKAGIEAERVDYPEPKLAKSDFSDKPLSVFDGSFAIVTRFHAPDNAAPGAGVVKGKLRYQACNNRECLMPKTVDIALPYDVQ